MDLFVRSVKFLSRLFGYFAAALMMPSNTMLSTRPVS